MQPVAINDDQISARKNQSESGSEQADSPAVTCPVCGAAVVQEKCKLICRSDKCRGRVVMNCSEF
jgi:hypothetical protein